MIQYELIQTGQVNIKPSDVNLHVGKARVRCKAVELIPGRHLPRGAKLRGGGVADEPSEHVADGNVVRTDAGPHTECQTAAMIEHAAHLPKRYQVIGKELQSLLTKNRVEAGVRQLQIKRAAFEPFDRRAGRRRERSEERRVGKG